MFHYYKKSSLFLGVMLVLLGLSNSFAQENLKSAQLIATLKNIKAGKTIKTSLSNEKGYDQAFEFIETHNGLPENLNKKYPGIRTFKGVASHGEVSYVSIVNGKIFGAILDKKGIGTFINKKNETLAFTQNQEPQCGEFNTSTTSRENIENGVDLKNVSNSSARVSSKAAISATSYSHGSTYRIFRFALTMSYWEFQDLGLSTVAEGLAYANARVNLMNDVFGKELAVKFELVPNNDQLIFTDPSDLFPEQYLGTNADSQFGNAKTVLDNVVGFNNYDWGFLMHPSGTGWAAGTFCTNGKHAGVANGSDWALMLHELGHQFGCPHAYHLDHSVDIPALTNCIVGSNGGEWFHSVNFEIAASLLDSRICATNAPTGNTIPTITMPLSSGFSIPASTPFVLAASATDPDATANLTYSWQHTNVLPAEEKNPTAAGRLIWAYPNPSASQNVRHIPDLASQVANMPDIYSILPTVSRPITTRFIVRDNQVPYGAVTYQEISFNVDGTAGPFLVTYPNTAVTVTGGQNMTVTWDVANTNNATVNCHHVNILLSIDEAATWTLLAGNVLNNGSYTVTLPNTPGTKCRIKVEAAGNIFYDMSNVNFTIVDANTNDFQFSAIDHYNDQYDETSSTFKFNFTQVGIFNHPVNVTYSGIPSGASITNPLQLTTSGDFDVVLQNTDAVTPGKYSITITLTEVGGTGITKSLVFYFVKKTTGTGNAGKALRVVQENRAMLATMQNLQTNTFTLAGWVKPNQTGRDWYRSGMLFFEEHTGIFINPAGKLGFIFNDLYAVEDLTTITFNQWNHVALVVAPDKATLYLNGIKVGEKIKLHTPINLGTTLKVGKREWYATVYGDYDEVKVFKKSLTETEVREEMHGNTDFQNSDLIQYYQFNEVTPGPVSPVSFEPVVLENSTSMVSSTVPSGTAIVKTLTQTTTLTDFAGTNVSLAFASNSADVAAVHKINVNPNAFGNIPNTQVNLSPSTYWEINAYPNAAGTPINAAVFKVNYDLTNSDNVANFLLYRRSQTADGDWTLLGSAFSFEAATESILFKNIPNTGQYVVYKVTDKIIQLTAVDVAMPCFLTAVTNKTFKYSFTGTALTSTINITNSNPDFVVSTDSLTGFVPSLSVSVSNGTPQVFYLKYVGSTLGTISNTVSLSADGAAAQTATQSFEFKKSVYGRGNAMSFGDVDNITIPTLTWKPTKFTVEFWYKPNNVFSNNNHQIGRYGQFFFESNSNKIIKIGIANSASGAITTASNVLIPDQWMHIAYTFNAGTAKLYLNGKLYQTQTGVGNPNTWSNFIIGYTSKSLNGLMDEFRIWSEERTEQQIQENMHLIEDLKYACTNGLKMYYQFESKTGNVVEDALGVYNGTVNNNPTIVVSSAPVGFGKSQTKDVTATGTYAYPLVNTTLAVTGTVPNGKIVVSQINDAPFAAPVTTDNMHSKYWIIDNYGTNAGLSVDLSLTPTSGFLNSSNTANYGIYKRGSNDFATWQAMVNPNVVAGNTLTLNGVSSFSQFCLVNLNLCADQLILAAGADNISAGTKVFQTSNAASAGVSGLIQATNIITGGNTTFDAGKKVELLPGFSVDARQGSNPVFHAKIGGCGN